MQPTQSIFVTCLTKKETKCDLLSAELSILSTVAASPVFKYTRTPQSTCTQAHLAPIPHSSNSKLTICGQSAASAPEVVAIQALKVRYFCDGYGFDAGSQFRCRSLQLRQRGNDECLACSILSEILDIRPIAVFSTV